jgi:hypothetical protein
MNKNKRQRIIIAIGVVIVFAGILYYSFFKQTPKQEEYTDSRAADLDLEQELALADSNPISKVLPIINKSPYYYIGPLFYLDKDNNLAFALEITFESENGKTAALSRLQEQGLSEYNPSKYTIFYTESALRR